MKNSFTEIKEAYENLIGGLADGKSIEDIAKKHSVSVDEIKKELKMGIEVEYEHTDDKDIATEIAMDHLMELPDYYTKLKHIEEE